MKRWDPLVRAIAQADCSLCGGKGHEASHHLCELCVRAYVADLEDAIREIPSSRIRFVRGDTGGRLEAWVRAEERCRPSNYWHLLHRLPVEVSGTWERILSEREGPTHWRSIRARRRR